MSTNQTQSSKRHRLLSPAAFGIHHKVSAELRSFFEAELRHSSFFFYEYFLEKPYTRWDDAQTSLHTFQTLTAPFLSRVIYQTGFIPALDLETLRTLRSANDIETVPLTPDSFRKYWSDLDKMRIQIKDSEVLRVLLQNWLGKEQGIQPEYFTSGSHIHSDQGVITTIASISTDYLRNDFPQAIIQRAKQDSSYAESAIGQLREYELVIRPWLRSREIKEVGIVSASISTQAIFWGECIVLCPMGSGERIEDKPSWMVGLKDFLRNRVMATYAPMLILLENYIYEDELQNKFKDLGINESNRTLPTPFEYRGINDEWIRVNTSYLRRLGSGTERPNAAGLAATPILPTVDHVYISLLSHCSKDYERWKKLTKLEQALVELWADRFGIILTDAHAVKESLIFTKYLIASPAMVDRTRQTIALRHMAEHPQTGKERAVKTALIIGGPGSGKDSMAQLVRLFSPGYRFGPVQALNMAMFRPKEIAVPLLLGLEARRSSTTSGEEISLFSLTGVLHQVIARDRDLTNQTDADTVTTKRGVTFVLDELNSLDMDTQGALLRLLENAELQPLGGLESTMKRMDILIVGVMNEDPQMIMKKRAMERVLREKQFFGGILGEALYEVFRNQRRLRDDLYYRLIRGGEIVLPELRERREDIPILFYFVVQIDLLLLIPEEIRNRWEIELSVYDALMNESLQWEGNLRELQTVARRIVTAAVDEYERRGSTDPVLTIRGAHVRKVLEESQRSAGLAVG